VGADGLRGGDDRDVDEVFAPAAAGRLPVAEVGADDGAELVCEMVSDREDPIVRADEPFET
jgi:hypothetical protein